MKCIRCDHDSKRKERTNRTCPKCNGRFAFEPGEGDKLTDVAFQNAINAVSADGQIRWGAEHLYYEVARRLIVSGRSKGGAALIIAIIMGGVALAVALFVSKLAALLPAALAVLALLIRGGLRDPHFVLLARGDFEKLLKQWCAAHGQPKTMITRAHVRGTPAPAPARKLEADITDYSFDRAIICDRARTADILLANHFHFENNCAVLSVDGYPEAHFETIRTMLKRNPRLRVFALHDATPQGCRLARKLATDAAWFVGQAPVIDVGLRPAQVKAFKSLCKPHTGPMVQIGDGISEAEAEWLNKQLLELAVLRPEQVLKRMYKALHRDDEGSGDSAGGDGGSGGTGTHDGERVINDTQSFAYEAGDVDSDADGFG